jgi:predicted DNA-binding transcriptional regulator AlpA
MPIVELADLPPLLTCREVLSLVRVSKATLRFWIDNGTFPAPVMLSERTHRWRRSEVLSFLEGPDVA